jgi:ABC-type dipeptide/oligopeptide/nickel transport system permease component
VAGAMVAIFYALVNLAVDLLYAAIDPRVRLE